MDYLPLTNSPEEKFNISIFENVFIIRQCWNTLGFWTLDIQNANGKNLVLGIKIVAHTKLLQQYPFFSFDFLSLNSSDPVRHNLSLFNLRIIKRY